jgi:hypothetical protein
MGIFIAIPVVAILTGSLSELSDAPGVTGLTGGRAFA